jgi:hypothetical protein
MRTFEGRTNLSGHVDKAEGVTPDREKVAAVNDLPTLRSGKDVK